MMKIVLSEGLSKSKRRKLNMEKREPKVFLTKLKKLAKKSILIL